jgi:hypothetical protein
MFIGFMKSGFIGISDCWRRVWGKVMFEMFGGISDPKIGLRSRGLLGSECREGNCGAAWDALGELIFFSMSSIYSLVKLLSLAHICCEGWSGFLNLNCKMIYLR